MIIVDVLSFTQEFPSTSVCRGSVHLSPKPSERRIRESPGCQRPASRRGPAPGLPLFLRNGRPDNRAGSGPRRRRRALCSQRRQYRRHRVRTERPGNRREPPLSRRRLAEARVRTTLQFLCEQAPQERGFFYHFMDSNTGKRIWKSEASSVDTAWLLCGVLHSGSTSGKIPTSASMLRSCWLAPIGNGC